jgi:serine/threonine protein kinase
MQLSEIETPQLAAGVQVGKYVLERKLGDGGMGTVWLARHAALGSSHSIKFLLPEVLIQQKARDRFLSEGQIQARIRHPNIVLVTDLISEPGLAGLVMEYVEGGTLEDLLRHRGALPWREAVGLLNGVLSGLAVAHDANVIHRDLKPSNVLIARQHDGSPLPKVCDFGIAKFSEGRAGTRTGNTLGTPHYMSPEQVRDASRVDRRSDIWSIGAILYEMLTGLRPFSSDSEFDIMTRIVAGARADLGSIRKDLPTPLYAIVDRALAVDPSARYADCHSLQRELVEVLAAYPDGAGTHSTPPAHASHSNLARSSGEHGAIAVAHNKEGHAPAHPADAHHAAGHHAEGHDEHGFFAPVTFPFKIPDWPSRLWVVPFLAYIPIADLIFLRGWRLELVRRMGRGERNPLPTVTRLEDYFSFFFQGCVLWFMTFLYAGVPFIIIFSTGSGFWGGFFELLGWGWDFLFSRQEQRALGDVLSDNAKRAAVRLGIEFAWLVISSPLYRAAMIRYAFTGGIGAFFSIPSNVAFVYRNRNLFGKVYLFSFAFGILSSIAASLLAMTGIGVALIPLLVLTVYYYSTGYEYGHLAQDVQSAPTFGSWLKGKVRASQPSPA